MNTYDWMDELNRRADGDEWFQARLEDVKAREPAFLAIRDTLTEAQRDALDDYIGACEDLEHSRTLLAYELGREKGGIVLIPPADHR